MGIYAVLIFSWLVDPQDVETTRVINQYPDYNSLVDLSVRHTFSLTNQI
jgi:hypothetical protein